ncbi:hypothetical protein [Endozoicomonas sp. SCSIO W0465]|uniref:hypothetical protein n=1 Tax=Endozoicomonas sp. SCSIO W0465 TaxID=2918516 RepID=UPI002075C0A7|nr:hypothetical protein [Endozoicomonas sp. SCSIO W0465]USE34597.1 hypothetical protein MJO57_20980 [Endozoicomonas sp. SCSIO W0465]
MIKSQHMGEDLFLNGNTGIAGLGLFALGLFQLISQPVQQAGLIQWALCRGGLVLVHGLRS